MTQEKPKARRRSQLALSADRIAEEAMALIDAEGLDGFSFRSLADRLGCKAMSIYYYFPSKQHLFEALVDICIGEIDIPATGSWREKLRAIAFSYRALALRHPGFFLYFCIFRLNNRSGLAYLNRILAVFEETGLPDGERAQRFRTLGYYIMGAGLDESLGYAHGPTAVEPVSPEEARHDFPAIMSVGPYFAKPYHGPTYEAGLDLLLDGIEAAIEHHGRTVAGP
ncbi:MAG: TetR/AcrR family transcriptional regulator [Paracoccaceae bacterium]